MNMRSKEVPLFVHIDRAFKISDQKIKNNKKILKK